MKNHNILNSSFCQYRFSAAMEGGAQYFWKIWVFIAHNVPAVYDGLTARIEKCVAFLGLANCGCSEPWEWSVAQ
jgi:hypothetical protein